MDVFGFEIFGLRVINFVFATCVVWTIALVAEVLDRHGIIHGELARKSMHIVGGIFIASTPLFMDQAEIIVLNLGLLAGFLVASGWLHMFKSLEVKRWTIGQFVYPIGVILTAVLYGVGPVFSFSVLMLALADGFAAIIGKWHGRIYYNFFGGHKTILGSFTFFVVAATLFATFMILEGIVSPLNIAIIYVGALLVMIAEGLIAGGMDNVVVPVVTGFILTQL